MSCCYTNRIHTVYSIFAKYYVLITVALFELNVYITLWPSGLYICFHGLHESHTNKFISSSSSSSSSTDNFELRLRLGLHCRVMVRFRVRLKLRQTLKRTPKIPLKADHPLFDWLTNCVILNHF